MSEIKIENVKLSMLVSNLKALIKSGDADKTSADAKRAEVAKLDQRFNVTGMRVALHVAARNATLGVPLAGKGRPSKEVADAVAEYKAEFGIGRTAERGWLLGQQLRKEAELKRSSDLKPLLRNPEACEAWLLTKEVSNQKQLEAFLSPDTRTAFYKLAEAFVGLELGTDVKEALETLKDPKMAKAFSKLAAAEKAKAVKREKAVKAKAEKAEKAAKAKAAKAEKAEAAKAA